MTMMFPSTRIKLMVLHYLRVGLRAGSYGVLIPRSTHVSKSQHEGKIPTFEPQETVEIWLITIKVIY